MDIFVYLFRIRATISDPPVVPPALKITPNPIPSRTPETKETIIKSPCSGENFFRKETNNNVLTDEHIAHIVELFASSEDVPHVARWVDLKEVEEQSYNLSVSSYIEAEDTREEIDITELNARIQKTVARIDALRSDIDTIITELEA